MNKILIGISNVCKEPGAYLKNIPLTLKSVFYTLVISFKTNKVKSNIIKNELKLVHDNSELKKYIEYIKKNGLSIFNSDFEKSVESEDIEVFSDEALNLKYVLLDEKKLYYPENYTDAWIKINYAGLLVEQSENSPHKYVDTQDMLKDAILFDCGSAEGILTLSQIESIKHAFLFEAGDMWKKPLEATFGIWKDKVDVIYKYLGDGNNGTLSLAEYLIYLNQNEKIDLSNDKIYIKMDIEGYEESVVETLIPLLRQYKSINLLVCVYHKSSAEKDIREMIPEGYIIKNREGYMTFVPLKGKVEYPFFTRGVITIEKE